MDNERDEIKDIAVQLKQLQIQETELLQRLKQLSEADRNPSRSPDTTRGFAIGDLVQTKNGFKTVRASSDAFHIEQFQSWLKPTRNHPQPTVIPRKGGITTRGNRSTLPRPTRRDRKNSEEERTSWMAILLIAPAVDSPTGS